MIEILLSSHGEMNDEVFTLSTSGHSKAAVCAGVSGLVGAVAAYLVALQTDQGDCIAVDVLQAHGKIRMDVAILVDDPCLRTVVDTAIAVLEIGLQQIQSMAGPSEILLSTEHGPYDVVRQWRTDREMDRHLMEAAIAK